MAVVPSVSPVGNAVVLLLVALEKFVESNVTAYKNVGELALP